ncbi:MAG: hypothetical protein Q7T74_02410 [Candidatus Saccharibacteria bacterium]|nr:hypothetical protein [Candidatus Saccharibacteria bacterium]
MKSKKKDWFYQGPFPHLIGAIGEYRDYLIEIEGKFAKDLDALEKRYKIDSKKAAKLLPQDEDTTWYYADELYRIDRVFRRSFRYSALVTIHALLETSMNSMCMFLQKKHNIGVGLQDIKGEGIERARLYLSKVCGIKFPETSHEWQELQKLNQVRNCIVHTNGDISLVISPKKLKMIVQNTHGLEIEAERYLIIDNSYLTAAISWLRSLFLELHDAALPNQ